MPNHRPSPMQEPLLSRTTAHADDLLTDASSPSGYSPSFVNRPPPISTQRNSARTSYLGLDHLSSSPPSQKLKILRPSSYTPTNPSDLGLRHGPDHRPPLPTLIHNRSKSSTDYTPADGLGFDIMPAQRVSSLSDPDAPIRYHMDTLSLGSMSSPSIDGGSSDGSEQTNLLNAAMKDPEPILRQSPDGAVEAGTLEGLVRHLLTDDVEFRTVFMSTYRLFSTGEAFFTILRRRFDDVGTTLSMEHRVPTCSSWVPHDLSYDCVSRFR